MKDRSVAALLRAWRDADAAWARAIGTEHERRLAHAVVHTWLAYQEATDFHGEALVLVADATSAYAAVGGGCESLLGWTPGELVGRNVASISAPGALEVSAGLWETFLVTGRQDGQYVLLHRDGSPVRFRYVARAHFPVAGFHTSVLTRLED